MAYGKIYMTAITILKENATWLSGYIRYSGKALTLLSRKVNPIKNNRLATEPAYADIPADKYAANKSEYDKDVSKGKYQIETKYKETLWEVTRIGRTMYINGGPKSNIIGSFDKPFGTKFEYVSYLSQTINGMRISLLK